jgi:pumilio RNA-binding family
MIIKLIYAMAPLISEIGTNQYGARVIQEFISYLRIEEIFQFFIQVITPYVKLLIIDLNGSYIIYKLMNIKSKSVKIIENIICLNIKDIAITRKGCNFLKKYFENSPDENLINIKKSILLNLKDIITDQYGNYIIQSIIEKPNSTFTNEYILEISKNVSLYSTNKFSSNAVEKCLENKNMKNIILEKILEKNVFEKILLDKFGNYVIQKALLTSDDKIRKIIFQKIKPLINRLKGEYFGQRLISKLNHQYPDINLDI